MEGLALEESHRDGSGHCSSQPWDDRKLYLSAMGEHADKVTFISHSVPGAMNACFQNAIAFEKEEMIWAD